MTLKQRVEQLLPNWEGWYPSLFEAARDLGVIRARPCAPSSLLLSNRHAGIKSDAMRAHREQWGGMDESGDRHGNGSKKTKNKNRNRARRR